MSSALITRKGKPEKLSCPALANQRFENKDKNEEQGIDPEIDKSARDQDRVQVVVRYHCLQNQNENEY